MDRIKVEAPSASYDVVVGTGLLAQFEELAGPFLTSGRVAVVTDANVRDLHGAALERAVADAGREIAWHVVDPGEGAKSWQGLEALSDWLLEQGVTRGDHVVAFGGGVVGDLTGFAAAIHKRGCGFIQVPTTLLAHVDSSVGGKTAINSSAGKNMVGAFHQPALVIADSDCLATLPNRELRAGFAEVLKYGLLGDADFFDWCAANGAALLAGDAALRRDAVAHCVRAKASIVAADETERTGTRALLNLGHTFGHALEAATGFGDALLHGEAVALGMVLAVKYSARTGLMSENAAQHVDEAIGRAGLPTAISALDLDADGATLADLMRHDKKVVGDSIPLILLRGIGAAFMQHDIDLADVASFLDQQLQAH
ncbi:3-dehydroquinate synthase [Pseudoblastomonas halimionae]|uniref:3-dehydroquinate synthase n=1 Tax=Alteriqipengyuania halimionae TaxID=1926630 RepID=A0A6I4TZU0_9SPHN|nr:3-dehydroquinate synthase [Alteriqipengyuania halimionae]MXP09329.1 3-dehydroquinate synthase [Alteriqipengyuania halimionae]